MDDGPKPVTRVIQAAVVALAAAWAVLFAWLAVTRHLAGGSHAEDLGFTDQVLANFLRGQWFRMSIYAGATWNTEIDISRLPRPDSLLAFHAEPMLLLLVPIYALGGGAVALLVLQAAVLAAGAVPAFSIARHFSGSTWVGLAVAAAYLLSPLGQWAALADFHSSSLAGPLLLLAVERLLVKHLPGQALVAAGLAATAREDVGAVLVALGLELLLLRRFRATALALLGLGASWSVVAAIIIRAHSGGAWPFDARYGPILGGGLGPALDALLRPTVLGYGASLLLSGAWLGLLAPLALLPATPALALNALSTSLWMAAGKAHYSALVLPFVTISAAAGLCRLRHRPSLMHLASATLVLTSAVGYALEGAGPLGGNYAPAFVTEHARKAESIADSLPPEATISASSALVPRLSRRPQVYVFPAVLDAELVFVDLHASAAPTSAGDVFLRMQSLLASSDWRVETATDGLLVLHREPHASAPDLTQLFSVLANSEATDQLQQGPFDGSVSLVSAALLQSPDGAVDIDGPRGILRTTWRAEQPLPSGTRLEFWVDLRDGRRLHFWDVASLWWNPPDRWPPGQAVIVDIPDVPLRHFKSWQANLIKIKHQGPRITPNAQ